MEIHIERLTPHQWKIFSEFAHRIAFGEIRDPEDERIDFALLGSMESSGGNIPVGYITCRELSARDLYWQFGGAFPPIEKTIWVCRCYEKAIQWCQGKYESVSAYVENTNGVMLKMALKWGFKIVGVKHVFSKTYVELQMELSL